MGTMTVIRQYTQELYLGGQIVMLSDLATVITLSDGTTVVMGWPY